MSILSRRRSDVYIKGCADDSSTSAPLVLTVQEPEVVQTDLEVVSFTVIEDTVNASSYILRLYYRNNGPTEVRAVILPIQFETVSSFRDATTEINYATSAFYSDDGVTLGLTEFFLNNGNPVAALDGGFKSFILRWGGFRF